MLEKYGTGGEHWASCCTCWSTSGSDGPDKSRRRSCSSCSGGEGVARLSAETAGMRGAGAAGMEAAPWEALIMAAACRAWLAAMVCLLREAGMLRDSDSSVPSVAAVKPSPSSPGRKKVTEGSKKTKKEKRTVSSGCSLVDK